MTSTEERQSGTDLVQLHTLWRQSTIDEDDFVELVRAWVDETGLEAPLSLLLTVLPEEGAPTQVPWGLAVHVADAEQRNDLLARIVCADRGWDYRGREDFAPVPLAVAAGLSDARFLGNRSGVRYRVGIEWRGLHADGSAQVGGATLAPYDDDTHLSALGENGTAPEPPPVPTRPTIGARLA